MAICMKAPASYRPQECYSMGHQGRVRKRALARLIKMFAA
jgi:hypothetical protein